MEIRFVTVNEQIEDILFPHFELASSQRAPTNCQASILINKKMHQQMLKILLLPKNKNTKRKISYANLIAIARPRRSTCLGRECWSLRLLWCGLVTHHPEFLFCVNLLGSWLATLKKISAILSDCLNLND